MKDSGIPYLGPVPTSWDVQKLRYSVKWKSEKGYPDAEVLALYRDYGVIPKSSRDDNHNVTSLDTSTYKYVETGDFVINKMKAWQGSMGVSSYSGIISPAYHVCSITNDDIHRPYFHYLLRNVAYLPEFARLSTGLRIGQWDLSFDDFRNLPFLLPDKSEQERIANLLDTKCADIDKVIEQTCATIEEYKKLKQAIITEAVTKGVRGPRSMKPSGVEWIGDIPEEWRVCKLKKVITFINGYAFDSSALSSDGDIWVIRIGDLKNGLVLYESALKSHYSSELDRFRILDGDILIAMSGATVGKIAIVQNLPVCACINQRVGIIRTNINGFIKYILMSTGFGRLISLLSEGTAQPNISTENIKDFVICLPDSLEQQEISSYLDTKCSEIDRIIEKKEQLIEELGSYRKSLIYEYVTGKKEVTA